MIAETPRLRIRELLVKDAEFVLALVSDPSFIENIGDKGVTDLESARRFILEGPWTRQEKPGHGQFVLELKREGVPIGVCGLLYRKLLDETDIGFALLPRYWRCGYAFEAASAL
ncbi:MAG: GNAT family N-acetyltransferase, partial [bacterium]|nr:GNAT family N-acetyltransferase [bacterium]